MKNLKRKKKQHKHRREKTNKKQKGGMMLDPEVIDKVITAVLAVVSYMLGRVFKKNKRA